MSGYPIKVHGFSSTPVVIYPSFAVDTWVAIFVTISGPQTRVVGFLKEQFLSVSGERERRVGKPGFYREGLQDREKKSNSSPVFCRAAERTHDRCARVLDKKSDPARCFSWMSWSSWQLDFLFSYLFFWLMVFITS